MLSRRDALRGGTATLAAIAAGGAVAAAVPESADEPLLELVQQRDDALAKIKRTSDWIDIQLEKLPEWAKDGPDGFRGHSGWPDVSDMPAFKARRYVTFGCLGRRPSLPQVEHYNTLQFCGIDPENTDQRQHYEAIKADGEARIQAWHERRREQQALERELGVGDEDALLEPYFERRDEIEQLVAETPARSFVGIVAKLRLFADMEEIDLGDDAEYVCDRLLAGAVRDIERLAGEASS